MARAFELARVGVRLTLTGTLRGELRGCLDGDGFDRRARGNGRRGLGVASRAQNESRGHEREKDEKSERDARPWGELHERLGLAR